MNDVSRGTPKVRPAYLSRWQLAALDAGAMTAVRWPIDRTNSRVSPGDFDGLDFDRGRAFRQDGRLELRCRCKFRSGAVRVVAVTPTISPGDLYWVRDTDQGGARKNSRYVLEVVWRDVARLQDMSDADALTYGVAALPNLLAETGTPRAWYSRTRPLAWAQNGWVWVVGFTVHRANIDEFTKITQPKEHT